MTACFDTAKLIVFTSVGTIGVSVLLVLAVIGYDALTAGS